MRIKYLHREDNTYYARMAVPAGLRKTLGRWELKDTLETDSLSDAKLRLPAIVNRYKADIAMAKAGIFVPKEVAAPPQIARPDVDMALAAWSFKLATTRVANTAPPTLALIATIMRLERAAADPDGWRQVPDFDARAVEALADGGLALTKHELAPFRQSIAITFLFAERWKEKSRRQRVLDDTDLEELTATALTFPEPAKRPSITIQSLFDRWITAQPPRAEKELGRLNHQIRRLTECVGNINSNELTRVQIEEFFTLLVNFPGRKRNKELNAMHFRDLVTHNEDMEEPVPGLTRTTCLEWFQSFRRMFDYGINLELDGLKGVRNPFEGMNSFVKGAASVPRRAFTPDEIKAIFAQPLFVIEEGWKKWLPILALHHGARLSEIAALPRARFVEIEGHYFFDLLTDEADKKKFRVKNQTAKRMIPLHPAVKEAFLAYFATLNGEWLFPDLNHSTRHGPGHEVSKWFGEWLNSIGLDDPAIAFHSFRHAWKRRARATPAVKEEMHNVISGHAGFGVGPHYGRGADLAPLVRDMALITFQEFPIAVLGQT